jgi:signal transduction histidine kinase
MKKSDKEKTILLVDDEEDIRDVLGISLSDIGYNVHAVENGEEAILLFKKINPAIVLTDIKMPGMDGIELLRKVKHENPDTEVIMITGHGDMNLAIKSLKYEATDFITKPINVDALEIALKRANDRMIMKRRLREYTENLEELLKEKTELRDRLSSLGLMIGSISHGIKGLLTGLDGGIYIVDSGLKKQDQGLVDEGWEAVKITIRRIRKMIQDILFYTKKRELQRKPVNIIEFADDIASFIELKMKENSIGFKKDFNITTSKFEIDTTAFRSALINILENAMDACIKDQLKKTHQIEFSVKQDGRYILFEISDTGIGMDEDTVDKIFTLFFSSKGDKGTGLGLFIAGNIIEQHHGTIKVNSAPGKGTKFSIRIPSKTASSHRKSGG